MTVVARIDRPVTVARAAAAPRTGRMFPAHELAANTAEPAQIAPADLTSLLHLQEAEAEGERKRRTQRRAQDMLACLAALQRAMVAGEDGAGVVRELSALQADEHPTGDPVLDDLLRSVRLRARIEMARYGL